VLPVLAWAEAAWPGRSWTGARILHGAFHHVVLTDQCAARIARGQDHRARVAREARLLRTAGQLGLTCAVPSLLDGPVSFRDRSGVLTTVVPGDSRDTGRWPDVRGGLLAILDELSLARPVAGQPPPTVRMWCGGPDWPAIVEGRLGHHLPHGLADRAMAVVADVIAVERESAAGFVHGDFGLHNVLWQSATACGLIDFDHLAWGDPAIDVAPLVGSFSAGQLSGDFDRDLLRRAMFHRASLSLQVAAAAELAGDGALRDHALGNFTVRFRAGTLYDPAGTSPVRR
jgi:Ser/Thr protein kinase RdoA (MazF antagonist)